MTRTLKVESVCGRCGRTEESTMDMQAALNLDKEDEARDVADKQLGNVVNEALDASYPDIVVAVRQPDGSYAVKGLRNLCNQPDAKRNKGCATRVETLVDDIFMVKPPVVRKPKPQDEAAAPQESLPTDKKPATDSVPTRGTVAPIKGGPKK